MENDFEQILKLLNEEQQEAVDHIEGPVFVLAGPGTGKTHILATRIGQILKQTDVYPSNILCLTFSDAGVNAMRERLIRFIGPTDAHRIFISTFHSFCNQIIQDNLELFGYNDLSPLSDLERIEVIHRLLQELSFDHPLKKTTKDLFFYTAHLSHLFRSMKSEGWSPEHIKGKTLRYLEELPNNPDYIYKRKYGNNNKGDVKTGKIENEAWKMERLVAAAELYPRYNQLLLEQKRYDYEDMILWVIEAFKKYPWLLRRYQEQFLYILVDEYQDTNGAQNQILLHLINYWESPNIFIVGDDDQSIYEFQGARLHNLIDFYQAYESNLRFIVLKDNYRSSQHILDAARLVISKNENRVTSLIPGVTKKLEAKNKQVKNSELRIGVFAFPNKTQENIGILKAVKAQLNKGVNPEDIAVIYARHKQSDQLIYLLKKQGIPYNTKKEVDILHEPVVKQILTILNFYNLETRHPNSGDHLVIPILHFPFWKINMQDIATLSVYYQKRKLEEPDFSWKTLIINIKDLELKDSLKEVSFLHTVEHFFSFLFSEASMLSLPRLFQHILTKSGLLEQLLEKEEKEWYLNVLYTLHQFIIGETEKNPGLTLQELLVILEKMLKGRISLPAEKRATAGGIQFLTAHSSKGLEFSHVFMIDLLDDSWGPRNSSGRTQFSFPENLTYSTENDETEARRRLFYVALTRAKKFLHLSYSKRKPDGKATKRSRFVDELCTHPKIPVIEKDVPDHQVFEGILQQLDAQVPKVDLPERSHLMELLSGFQMTISNLDSFLNCPIGFYYNYVIKAPIGRTVGGTYGVIMHTALEWLFQEMRSHKKKEYPSLSRLLSVFDRSIHQYKGAFDLHIYNHYLKKGKETLSRIYKDHLPHWSKEVKLELNLRNIEVNGIPIKGVIDKVELLPNQEAIVVDYKTTVYQSSRLSRPTTQNPTGGKYWRQLTFYKILLENASTFRRRTNHGKIIFLSPDKKGQSIEKTIELGPEDVEQLKTIITSTYKKVMNLEFSNGCDKPNCPWCAMTEKRLENTLLEAPEIEELDDKL